MSASRSSWVWSGVLIHTRAIGLCGAAAAGAVSAELPRTVSATAAASAPVRRNRWRITASPWPISPVQGASQRRSRLTSAPYAAAASLLLSDSAAADRSSGPVCVVVGIAVPGVGDDEPEERRAGQIAGQVHRGVAAANSPAVGHLGAVAEHLEVHRAAVAHLVVEADVAGEGCAPPADVQVDLTRRMRADALRVRHAADRHWVTVTGRRLAVAHVALDRSPAVRGARPLQVADIRGAGRGRIRDENVRAAARAARP